MRYLFYFIVILPMLVCLGCQQVGQTEPDVAETKAVDSISENSSPTANNQSMPLDESVDTNESDRTKTQIPEDEELEPSESSNDQAGSQQNSDSQSTSEDPELPSLPEIDLEAREAESERANQLSPDPIEPEVQTIDIPASWKRLSEQHEIWVDMQNKQVIVAGNICLNAGLLEVFACPRNTKEHEAIVSVNAFSSQVHAALLAIGAKPGRPVRWPMTEDEAYSPASGPVIAIDVVWKEDDREPEQVRAQKWILDTRSGTEMSVDWVFGGSETFTDEESGESYYLGDSGEMVCLSNFSTATLDVPVESSDANEGLLFEANTDKIPPIDTKVYLIFKPELN